MRSVLPANRDNGTFEEPSRPHINLDKPTHEWYKNLRCKFQVILIGFSESSDSVEKILLVV